MGRVAVLLVTLGTGAALARADEAPTAKCAVRLIHAQHDEGGIDPRITLLRPYLQKEPFTAWKSFKLVYEQDVTVAPESTVTFPVPRDKQGELTYVEHLMTPEGKHRLRLRLAITHGERRVLNTTFVLDEGGVLLHAGQKHENGMLILGVSCETH
jgi:hypothetical protein